MTEFQNKSFSVYPGERGGQEYRDNWDRIFGKKEKAQPVEAEPTFTCCCDEHAGPKARCYDCPDHGHTFWDPTVPRPV